MELKLKGVIFYPWKSSPKDLLSFNKNQVQRTRFLFMELEPRGRFVQPHHPIQTRADIYTPIHLTIVTHTQTHTGPASHSSNPNTDRHSHFASHSATPSLKPTSILTTDHSHSNPTPVLTVSLTLQTQIHSNPNTSPHSHSRSLAYSISSYSSIG